jgi:HupF/HypC family
MNETVRTANDQLFTGGCRLDHAGCIVCADAGIPVRVLAVTGADALCEDAGGGRATIAIDLVAPVTIGEVLVTHGGVAIGRSRET